MNPAEERRVFCPGCTEHYMLHCCRNGPGFVPELDLAMELDGRLIGPAAQRSCATAGGSCRS